MTAYADIHIEVPRVPCRELRDGRSGESSASIREKVMAARQRRRPRPPRLRGHPVPHDRTAVLAVTGTRRDHHPTPLTRSKSQTVLQHPATRSVPAVLYHCKMCQTPHRCRNVDDDLPGGELALAHRAHRERDGVGLDLLVPIRQVGQDDFPRENHLVAFVQVDRLVRRVDQRLGRRRRQQNGQGCKGQRFGFRVCDYGVVYFFCGSRIDVGCALFFRFASSAS